jgi:hypothetical protein
LLTSKSSRDHVFLIVNTETVKEEFIGKREGGSVSDANLSTPNVRNTVSWVPQQLSCLEGRDILLFIILL